MDLPLSSDGRLERCMETSGQHAQQAYRSRVYERHRDALPFQVPGHCGAAAVESSFAHPVPILHSRHTALSANNRHPAHLSLTAFKTKILPSGTSCLKACAGNIAQGCGFHNCMSHVSQVNLSCLQQQSEAHQVSTSPAVPDRPHFAGNEDHL